MCISRVHGRHKPAIMFRQVEFGSSVQRGARGHRFQVLVFYPVHTGLPAHTSVLGERPTLFWQRPAHGMAFTFSCRAVEPILKVGTTKPGWGGI